MNPFFFAGQFSHPVAPFFPNQISGLAAWFDASNSSSVLLSGNNVTGWQDMSPYGRGVFAGAGAYPIYNSSGFSGGYPTILFSGNSDYLSNTTFSLAQSATWVVIAYYTGSLTSSDYLIFGGNGGGVTSTQEVGILNQSSSYNNTILYGGAFAATSCYAPTGMFSPSCLVGIFNGTNSVININGNNLTTGTTATNTIVGLTIGNGVQRTSEGWNGPISEIIAYSGVLNSSQIAQIHQYAQNKWGTP